MAPFTPFFSEHVFQELRKMNSTEPLSVHLCDYPVANVDLINSDLEVAVGRMQQIILLGRQKRNLVQIKVKTPLKRLTIIHKDEKLLAEINKLSVYIQTELNVKNIELSTDESKFIKLYAKANLPVLGKKLGKEMGKYKALIEKLDGKALIELEEEGSLMIEDVKFFPEEVLIFREAKEGTEAMSNRFISVDIDTKLDQGLIDEGFAREISSAIQKQRKTINLKVDDRINVAFSGNDKFNTLLNNPLHSKYIQDQTLAQGVKEVAILQGITVEINIDDEILGSFVITKA